MANDLLIQSEPETATAADPRAGHELDALLGKAFEEKSIFVDLYENIRDVFFPVKLPPLELTSRPIPVPDRMAVKANPWAVGISTTVNLSILLMLLFFVVKKVIEPAKIPMLMTPIEVSEFKAPKAANDMGGGGGGNQTPDMTKGKLPKFEKQPIVPPAELIDKPKLAMDSAIDVQKDIQLDNDPKMPNIGFKNATNVQLGRYGSGTGGGMGPGNGNGFGPGQGGNYGGGIERVGGLVSAPVALNSVEAEFSDEARRAKYQGVVLVAVIVDAQGNPQNPRVVRSLGMGLDEKAIEAVRKYKFKPAMKGKTPVAVMINVEVNFRLY